MKRIGSLARILPLALLLACMVLPAHADMGPKPSVTVTAEGVGERGCYVTLLSTVRSTGPHSSVWKVSPDGERYRNPDGGPGMDRDDPEYPVYRAFLDYEEDDPEGLFFLGEYSFGPVTDAEPFRWGYYPPQSFKILLYFPETDSFAVTSELLERYAFDSYYTVDLTGLELAPGETVAGLSAEKSYDHSGELAGLAARAALTVAVELLLALCFKLNTKRQLLVILLVNLVTQTGLNLGLNWWAYRNGTLFIVIPYLLMELGVVLVEFAAYFVWLTDKEKRAGRIWRYALAANLASFLAGGALMKVFPLIF